MADSFTFFDKIKSSVISLQSTIEDFFVSEAHADVITTTPIMYVGGLYEVNMATSIATKSIFLGDMRIATVDSTGKTLFYHGDHLGGTNVITDSTGTVKELTEYEPFGQYSRHEKYGSNDEVAKFYFTGKQLDEATGLYYFGARYYSALIGKFITPDTIVQSPDNPQTLNRFAYCGNNPTCRIDPSGHFWFVAAIIAAIKAITVASIIKGAIIGAVLGAATAAATGGNIGMGALAGAIGGAFFGAAGDIIAHAGAAGGSLGSTMAAVTHVMAGGISGGINSVVQGGNFGQGALIGGISAGVAKVVGEKIPYFGAGGKEGFLEFSGNTVRQAVIGAAIGGAVSAATGGEFSNGARLGAISAALGYAANKSNHDGFVKKTMNMVDRIFKNISTKLIEGDFGSAPAKVFSRGMSGAKTIVDIKGTWADSDPEFNNYEKITVSALQVGATYVTIQASSYGYEVGLGLGTPFGQGGSWGIAGATFAGATAAEGGRMIIDATKTYFKNN